MLSGKKRLDAAEPGHPPPTRMASPYPAYTRLDTDSYAYFLSAIFTISPIGEHLLPTEKLGSIQLWYHMLYIY